MQIAVSESASGKSVDLRNLAANICGARRDRDEIFNNPLFANPAWNLLLDIYSRSGNVEKISVKSVCRGSLVPETTAVRYIASLAEHGYVRSSLGDDRFPTVSMTALGIDLMVKWLTRVNAPKFFGSGG
ncbi:hypothetical protein D3Y57_17655 [Sphingomonas paeninsulae]|uniref:HTH marR-type domain-containing protein n=1 Tax=Sphingomonas paeninsulae TaxID=2319844 RepID=A0A494TNJ4_SPHPE|nr:hypothetical protein [Sphingomonas paeninsulae]AYJ87421.1 hypothetical protein D3Y57_17655 [Sphingomonas paeninsulae]